ncbi:LOW QUALITY PROTEIN: uncharacterized protein V1477_000629 [Vespula maculifrons]|uniref:Uncharacterized protein n=1 Tax=Vespula maculifrons TaxID=7453 RepID=A0ABD2D2C2_VESMC
MDLEIFTLTEDFEELSPRVDLEIFSSFEDFENLSPRKFSNLLRTENLSPRVDLEIFAPIGDFENLSPRLDLEIFSSFEDFENLSPRKFSHLWRTLKIYLHEWTWKFSHLWGTLKILSPRVDLEIFESFEDFENLSPRVDLEIFARCQIRASIIEDLKHDRSCLEMSEADGVDSGAICKRDANTGRIERTLLRVSVGTGVVFSGANKSPTVMDFIDTTGRVSRCLKPTVWTVEQSVSGVLYISNYAGNAYFAVESFGHSRECPSAINSPTGDFVLFVRRLFVHAGPANLKVNSSLARGSPDAATSTRWDLVTLLCFGIRREYTEIFAGAIRASINEQLIQIYNSLFDFRLKCEVGILGFEGRQQCRFPVQLCVGCRPVNLEIFANAIRASINEELIQIYNSLFDFRLKCEVGILGFEGRQQCRCFGHRRVNLEIFADAIRASINEQLIQIYNSLFDFRLKCEVGILGFEGRQQCRFPVQLCVGCRPVNLEIFANAIRASINEELIQIYNSLFDFRLKCEVGILGFEGRQQCRFLVQLCVGCRPVNLEIFANAIRASIDEQLIQIYNSLFDFRLKCEVGILGFEGRQQCRFPVQLCVGCRPVNLEIFANAIRASINEELIQIYNSLFDFRLKCEVGILGFEGRQQCRCFGHRRVNLEIFADAIRASINEQLIQIYNSLFDFRLKCEVGILGFEGRQQCRFPVQLCVGCRPVNLEIFANAIRASINEELIQIYNSLFDFRLKCEVGILGFEGRQQCRFLVQLCVGCRPVNLEIFANAIRASIDEQLIQIYNSLFDFRLKCEVGILGFEGRQQCRWGYSVWMNDNNVGSLADFRVPGSVVLWTSTSELRNFRGCHSCKLKCEVGILGFEGRQQCRSGLRNFRTFERQNLSPRVDLEIFKLLGNFENSISMSGLRNFHTFGGTLKILSPRVDLEIFKLLENFENSISMSGLRNLHHFTEL